jgi:arylsulfatase A-like enzyme
MAEIEDRERRAARWARCAVLAACAALAACGADEPETPPRAPHEQVVLLVVFDALHADHLSHLGYERATTPNLDRLASDGVSFSNCFSPAPYTRAGIPSILTGRLPDHHGVTGGGAVLASGETTIAELFGELDLPTRGAVANLNGSEVYALDQGFVEFRNHMLVEEGRSADIEKGGFTFHQPRAVEFTARVRGWLDTDANGPAFYYLHYLEPHPPFDPPQEFRARWIDPAYDGVFASGITKYQIMETKGEIEASPADRAAVRALYDANLAYADAQFGDVLDELRARGLYDDAWIVVTSDHGEALWQHDEFGHNRQLFDEMVNVPLIVKPPKGTPVRPRVETALVSTLDILPSLVEWCGLGAPTEALDGRSLAPLLAPVHASAGAPGAALGDDGTRELILRTHADVPDLALRTSRDKTIVLRGPEGGVRALEHYDLVRDPGEFENVAKTHADVARARSVRLRDWFAGAAARQLPRDSVELNEAQALLLERLGYKSE